MPPSSSPRVKVGFRTLGRDDACRSRGGKRLPGLKAIASPYVQGGSRLRAGRRKKDDRRLGPICFSSARGSQDPRYAATNHVEYWAEGVQYYFDAHLRP